MKQPKKLTRTQKETLSAYNLNANEWEYLKDVGDTYFMIRHKATHQTKIIDKYRRKNNGSFN